ncbi:MAG: hypothetical protein U0805_14685 [Pirellulales bacterium]
MDERDVLNAWRLLFRSQPVTADTLTKAESLLDGLSGESPLHLRLAGELDELKGAAAKPKKKPARRAVT